MFPRHTKALWCVGEESSHNGIDFAAEDAFVRPCESGITKECRSTGEDLLVRGLDMCVGANDGADFSIQHPCHGNLLGSSLGVNVHEDDGCLCATFLDLRQRGVEGIVQVSHECSPLHIDHGDGRFAIAAAGELYRGILEDIEANDYQVFTRRAHVTGWGKLRRLPGIWWRARMGYTRDGQ